MKAYLLVVLLAVVGCANNQVIFENNRVQSSDGRLASTLEWVKVKNGKIDFLIIVSNKGDNSVFWEQNATVATYGNISSSTIIHGNKGQVIPAGGAVRSVVTLGFSEPFPMYSSGTLTISPVYDYKGGAKGEKLDSLTHSFVVQKRQFSN